MAEGIFDRLRSRFAAPSRPARSSPFSPTGVGGFTVYGGFLQGGEVNAQLVGQQRWRNASDIMANFSIVAASIRYYFNLCAHPAWKCEPADDSDEAKKYAEFMESVLYEMDESWSRIIRRSALFKFHGFGFHEWTAKRREEDDRIGIASVRPRPCHTIERWDLDDKAGLKGVWQRAPQTGQEIYLPRPKLVYLIDDMLSDSPDGLGWYRHLVEPTNRLKEYLRLEGVGYERDLSGIPVGRAPIGLINDMVKRGDLSKEEGDKLIRDMQQFVKLKSKQPETGIVIESAPYIIKTDTGEQATSVLQWGLDLLTGEQTSIDKLGDAIRRTAFDIALIMGTQSMLVGREGAGSMALSKDQSQNLFLNVNSTLTDMAECYDRDLIGTIWALNGFPPEMRPTLKTEDASFRDVEQVARVLADMGNAGAILMPDDPAIDDVRDLLGVSRQPEIPEDLLGMVRETTLLGHPPAPEPGTGDDLPKQEDKTA